MTITIDYDNDQVIIQSKNVETAQYRGVTHTLKQIENMMNEVLNRLDDSRLASATPGFEIILQKQDDGIIIGIGEW